MIASELLKILTSAAALIALAIQPTWCFGASFDCRKAATAVEKLVCSSNEVRALDVRLYEEYQRAQRLSSEDSVIRTQQRRWLKESRSSCKTVECLSEVYETRISQLQSSISYKECEDESGNSLSFGYCDARFKEETETTINDLIALISARYDSRQMERFNQLQSEWRKNVDCSCYEQVGWGTGPGHSAMIVGCEKNEVERRLLEVREIVVGNQDLEYGGTVPKSCSEIRQAKEADPEYRMFEAIRKNDIKSVKRLVEGGASVPVWRDGQTPLSIATQNNNTEMVAYLLSRGANPAQDRVAMLSALSQCNMKLVVLLVEHGYPAKTDDWVYDPLPTAAYHGCLDIIKYLVSKGADIKSSRPLPMAASGCRIEIVHYLIAQGDDVQSPDRVSSTPLKRATDIAVKYPNRRDACKSVIEALLKAGASPESAYDAAASDSEITSLLHSRPERP